MCLSNPVASSMPGMKLMPESFKNTVNKLPMAKPINKVLDNSLAAGAIKKVKKNDSAASAVLNA